MLITELIAERAAIRADHPFLFHGGRRVSYREFDAQTNQVAHALIGLGVEKGDRVTVAMGNSVEYLLATFGALKAGAVYHPINAALGAKELSYIIGHAEPRLLITDQANAPHLLGGDMQVPPSTRVVGFASERLEPLETLIARSPRSAVPVNLSAGDPSTLLYTSGTTGNPKGVLFQHESTGAAGLHFLNTLGIGQDDTILAVTPLFHGNAWGAVGTALQAGGTVAFPTAFSASEFWPLVHASGATVLYTLGTILAILLTREPTDLERSSPLRIILGLGSAPIREQIIRRFGVREVAECFGSTDAGVVTITPLGAAPRAGSCGPAVPGVTLRIVDDDGHTLPVRQPGEILVASPHTMKAYFRDPEQTAQTLRDGWFHTGDLGYLDEDGWLYFVDRKKDVIRRGGENMSSAYIEKVLREHPRVIEAAVIGIPDPVLGQEVKAFIVANGTVTADELREFASARLARFQVPRLWEFRDSLPKTATQRIEKYKLRQESGGGDKPLLG
jgi:acyl-CoA synthetase (AMP-forming)/AMP-acid ligase II